MTIPAILRKAARRVREGWVQGRSRDGHRVCAGQALIDVGERPSHDAPAVRTLARLVCQSRYRENGDEIVAWNNKADQTAESVAMTMELCALLVEEGNDAVQG